MRADPAAVVVGGGVGLAQGSTGSQALATARAHIYADTSRQVPIVPAATGRDAGIIGARQPASFRRASTAVDVPAERRLCQPGSR
jgi:predicted NBD/HSP70 family sugar kinase